jgi:deoxyribonuclease-4
MRVGAHVPTRGRLANAVDYALQAGCDCFQIFISNPRAWAPPNVPSGQAEEFRERRAEAGLGPVFVHSSYLINVASSDDAFRRRSVDLARHELQATAEIGAEGLVVHAGAGGTGERSRALDRAAESLLAVASADGPEVVIELTAGGAGAVASTIPQAAELLAAVGRHPKVSLCVDTCHLFAAGYALDDAQGTADLVEELRRERLVRRFRLVHANDARDPRGSRRDRHEHVGQGFIGEGGFRAVLAEPAVRRCAVLVETAGDLDAHRGDVAALRRLAGV